MCWFELYVHIYRYVDGYVPYWLEGSTYTEAKENSRFSESDEVQWRTCVYARSRYVQNGWREGEKKKREKDEGKKKYDASSIDYIIFRTYCRHI